MLFVRVLFGFELDWIHDYDKALKLAKESHKDVYLFVGADACPYCKRLKDETLSKKYIMDKIKEKFVPIYLSRNQHKIPAKFEKYGAPRHYFLTSDGKIYDEDAGFLNPDDFLAMLKEAEFYKDK